MISRRDLVASLGTAAVAGTLIGCATLGGPKRKRSVVVVGAGFGGATCARYMKRRDPSMRVILVEPAVRFVTCPFSNTVIGGFRRLEDITHGYDRLAAKGIEIVHAKAEAIDGNTRHVTLDDGARIHYDRLVLSPGVDLIWNAIEGYDENAAEIFPHAWKAGPQTMLLRRQLESMDDGGLVVISAPDNPYRCPPGPYERASLIAAYLTAHKPRSKILILDDKDTFTKQELFTSAWERLYPGMIEWVSRSAGGRVVRVDARARTVHTDFDDFSPAVANIVPPQRAAGIARTNGLDEGRGWCEIEPVTFESTVVPRIHLIGDTINANPMPKSAFAANNQAKACALSVVALLDRDEPPTPKLMNTCYSLVAPNYGINIAAVYQRSAEGLSVVPGSSGISPLVAPPQTRALEADYARSWYDNITKDAFG
jgi:sulfide dehydrogenase [flavocytochrome c] flavoprotein subunit